MGMRQAELKRKASVSVPRYASARVPPASISGIHPVQPSSHWWGTQRQIPSERLQIIYGIACIDLRGLFSQKFIQTNAKV